MNEIPTSSEPGEVVFNVAQKCLAFMEGQPLGVAIEVQAQIALMMALNLMQSEHERR